MSSNNKIIQVWLAEKKKQTSKNIFNILVHIKPSKW